MSAPEGRGMIDSERWQCPECRQTFIGGRAPRCVQCLLTVLRKLTTS